MRWLTFALLAALAICCQTTIAPRLGVRPLPGREGRRAPVLSQPGHLVDLDQRKRAGHDAVLSGACLDHGLENLRAETPSRSPGGVRPCRSSGFASPGAPSVSREVQPYQCSPRGGGHDPHRDR